MDSSLMVPRFIYLFIYLCIIIIINFRASPIWCLMTSRQQGLVANISLLPPYYAKKLVFFIQNYYMGWF